MPDDIEDNYLNLRDLFNDEVKKVLGLTNTFIKSNKSRRQVIAKSLDSKLKEISNIVNNLNDQLFAISVKNANYKERSYFKEKVYNNFNTIKENLERELEPYLSGQSDIMADFKEELMELMRLMVNANVGQAVNPDTVREKKEREVIKQAYSAIKPLKDIKDLTNFLTSVELILSETNCPIVTNKILKIAQTNVRHVAIETKTYEKFDDFKADLISCFRSLMTVTEAEDRINSLTQGYNEGVDVYYRRVAELKAQYDAASLSERRAAGATLDAFRIKEMEVKVARAFTRGLTNGVRGFIFSQSENLAQAYSIAMEAESSFKKNQQIRNLEKQASQKKVEQKPNWKSEKNPRASGKVENIFKNKERSSPSTTERKCYECGSTKHLKPDCPMAKSSSGTDEKVRPSSEKRNFDREGAKPKNSKDGGSGSTASAKSLKIKKLH